MRGKKAKRLRKLAQLIREQIKESQYQYPQVTRPKKTIITKQERYLISRALLHLRDHFTVKEIANLMNKSKNFIYKKLKELE
jgi:hypothetical protein